MKWFRELKKPARRDLEKYIQKLEDYCMIYRRIVEKFINCENKEEAGKYWEIITKKFDENLNLKSENQPVDKEEGHNQESKQS